MLIISTLLLAVAAAIQPQQVTATALGCDFSGVHQVKVWFWTDAEHKDRRPSNTIVPATLNGSNEMHFVFETPPGSFTVSYEAGRCESGTRGLVVLPNHDRTILVSMPKLPDGALTIATFLEGQTFVSGTVPVDGVGVGIVPSDDGRCPGRDALGLMPIVDNGAYYYSGYINKHYLFLRLFSSTLDILDVRLPILDTKSAANHYILRNVTVDDLRTLATHPISDRYQCVLKPSGDTVTL
jgi:hypothetical protein